ncbi:MAG TPA: hypothetical protein ENN17_11020 [bacterium]|nr:hypothetical protein [bacterium]
MDNFEQEHKERKWDKKRSERRPSRGDEKRIDEKVRQVIETAMTQLQDGLEPFEIHDLNGFQRMQVHRFFEKKQEYALKTYRNGEDFVLKIYPVGALKRLSEQRAQEVLMKGEPESLPPMGSYERFIVHTYLKDRGGIRTESHGEDAERHIEILPVFGRSLKKIKRKLT